MFYILVCFNSCYQKCFCTDRLNDSFVCQVGNKVNLAKLHELASEPKINNTFYIQNYNGLQGLLNNLQKKIYNIEGKMQA